jgi:hypothetical protein
MTEYRILSSRIKIIILILAINHLTINEENRLKIENRILKIDISRIDELEAKIQKLERKHGRIR